MIHGQINIKFIQVILFIRRTGLQQTVLYIE